MTKFRFAALVLVSGVSVLAGCTVQPGMFLQNPLAPLVSAVGGSDAPEGAITPITPELIARQRAEHVGGVPTDVQALFADPAPYRIGPGDILSIAVVDHPDLSIVTGAQYASGIGAIGAGYNVGPDGYIQFPFVGPVSLKGLTEYEARDRLSVALSKYLREPRVLVRVLAYRSARVFIEGEVRNPGVLSVDDVPLTLPEAIARAGGVTVNGERSAVALVRDGKTTSINPFELVENGVSPSRILLRGGDVLRVLSREELRVFVLGEVPRPAAQNLINGRLTLFEAMAAAGGVSPTTGNPRQVFVIRAADSPKPEIFHVDSSTPLAYAMTQGFELRPKDVVYVDPVPLVRWNRVISLILPSAQAVVVTDAALR